MFAYDRERLVFDLTENARGAFPMPFSRDWVVAGETVVVLYAGGGKHHDDVIRHVKSIGFLKQIDAIFALLGTNISPLKGILMMIFLFPRWDM